MSDSKLAKGRLLIPGSEKGGQGKSTILSFIIDWVRARHPDLAMKVYDPDHIHRTITRMYGVPGGGGEFLASEKHRLVPISLVGPDGLTVLDEVTDTFYESNVSIIDGVAQSFEEGFGAWARKLDFKGLQKAADFRVTYLLPVTDESSTVAQAGRTMNSRGPDADYLIVKIMSSGTTPVWDREGAAQTRAVAKSLGARVVAINRFSDEVSEALRVSEPADICDLLSTPMPTLYGASCGKGKAITDMQRNQCEVAWAEISAELDKVAAVILPPAYSAQVRVTD
ncbi:MAG TPA: hypothetical protein DCQ04_05525 [Actinobacteria bacterium]|nr:hypothetical protein [Actinomycetota bacterium]